MDNRDDRTLSRIAVVLGVPQSTFSDRTDQVAGNEFGWALVTLLEAFQATRDPIARSLCFKKITDESARLRSLSDASDREPRSYIKAR